MLRRCAIILGVLRYELNWMVLTAAMAAMVALAAGSAQADVFNMGTGQTSLQFVTVGDPGNAPMAWYNITAGSVASTYEIGKYEVTAGQYTAFLNAVAKTDTYGLYDPSMASGFAPCNIIRTYSSGSYTYSVAPDYANRPVNWIDWGSAVRFCNWLTNGQPTGLQNLSTTEDGSYYLNGATTETKLMAVTRKPGALYYLPTNDEWLKAAHYDPAKPGGAGYWVYPTRSDAEPSNTLSSTDTNNANYHGPGSSVTIGDPYYRTEVGAFASSPGPYGTYDQGGNIAEWTENTDRWYPSYGKDLLGGDFYDDATHLATSGPHGVGTASSAYYAGGFRVARVPEPGSMAMLAGIALAALLHWWRRRV